MEKVYQTYYQSEIGLLEITGAGAGILAVEYLDPKANGEAWQERRRVPELPVLKEALIQIDEYFTGLRQEFELNLLLQGTDFQQRVWKELLKIPYGKTATYKEVASRIEKDKAARAVGGAANRNKLAILIPCHRLVGTGGALTGYAGGLWRKEWLLRWEGVELDAYPKRAMD